MIFNLYSRVAVKLGDESHVFDRGRLMYTEAAEIEKVTGQSVAEWMTELGEYKITAVAALLHILRKREDIPSDFGSIQFNVAELDVVPLHEDGREYTPEEVADDLKARVAAAQAADDPGPTRAAPAKGVAPEETRATNGMSLSSLNGSGSGPGSGSGSRGRSSSGSKRTLTPG